MDDLRQRLENRADLEKLERDLAEIEQQDSDGDLPADALALAQLARVDLETARAAHIALCFRLSSPVQLERSAAREELERRIEAGEWKIYDPEARRWRPAAEILVSASRLDADLDRQEVKARQLERALIEAGAAPRQLKALDQLIHSAEELERDQQLSPVGLEALQKARLAYQEGLQQHRELTLKVRSGTLVERGEALAGLRRLIAAGETAFMEAPAGQWRPAAELLSLAELEMEGASARQADAVLGQVEELSQTKLKLALRTLYLALDRNIPYLETDRRRLEARYLELYATAASAPPSAPAGGEPQPGIPAEDQAGEQAIRDQEQKRLAGQFEASAEWLNQFFHSSITKPVQILLDEAAAPDAPVDRVVERIHMAEGLARSTLENSIEVPEALVKGAVILFKMGEVERARDLLARARPLYTLERVDKIHRYAVTAWLQGCAEYWLGRRLAGYADWKSARAYFKDLAAAVRREGQSEKEKWYRSRLVEMEVLGAQTFEEVYFQWMNPSDPQPLSPGLLEYRRRMETQFSKQQVPELRRTIGLMLEASRREPRPEVHRRALVDAAFFEYQLGDIPAAIEHLNAAWVGFQAGHRGAVALWLLGLVSWRLPSLRNDAILEWETSIRMFEDLRRDMDRANRQDRRRWYDAQINLMEASLKQWAALTVMQ